jgi:tight adherence protein B
MSSGPALIALFGVLVVALAGATELVMGNARRATLRESATGRPEPSRALAAGRGVSTAFARTRRGRRLQARLTAGAVNYEPLTFVLAALGGAIVAGYVVSLKFGTVLGAIAGVIVLRGTAMWLQRKVDQRADRFAAQLPEMARVLANGTSAGLSIVGALEIAVEELDEPASSELRVALEEVRIGQSFDRAFENLAERMPSRELGVLVSTLVIQQRAGGDLVHALSEMSVTLETRKDTLREVKTIMSGAVASAYAVAGLGIATVFLFDLIHPGAIDQLTGSVIGLAVLFVAGMLYAVGLVAIRRVTRVQT